ncbi:redox-sensitive transcriptional activator SoxR [Chromobacterium sinusclupearum]|jgi:MerR family redox-sensitive transcriptional activator SoxR|uniref:Redox-sensitive transcriptional activator SoxR n=1 Tax=Chromobacterium sinusclupearum TaxID=2077146 RepID=A0A2K4MJJ1_9NEIS|nr:MULTISPECIES: redox-sensitive transcriptional activator SoxR [Chromobacterium]OHX18473.1 redox-sensitive transcriptional activator SoxR [Chromobacterium amazonense]POA97240.1 redox-sensitive transcriptional activator SoxR [Chromobacterium sinusclupearum]
MNDTITIGYLAKRSGVAASALRFYESRGLIRSVGEPGKTRRFRRDALRRVSFIRAAQTLGLNLQEIGEALARLPQQRTPTVDDWARLSMAWKPLLQARIDALTRLRDQLDDCIGCGCLSLQKCKLFNPDDAAGGQGCGARFLLDEPAAE